MSRKKVRVGLVGTGRQGERHARVLSSLSRAELVGVSDLSFERGGAVAARYGVDFYPRFSDLLDEVDAVSIATPTDGHFSMALECIAKGKDLLIEKPLAASVAEAETLVREAERAGLILQVGHIERFNPAFLELQSVAQELQIVALSARRLSPFDTSNTEVDVVFDLMIHDIDVALALLGPELSCQLACQRSARTGSADYVMATLGAPEGPIVTLTASRVTEQKVRLIEITALGAYVEADLLNKSVYIYRRALPEFLANRQRPLRYRQESVVERIHIPTAEPLMLELESFVRCVAERGQPAVSGRDGLRALELAQAIRAQMNVAAAEPALAAAY